MWWLTQTAAIFKWKQTDIDSFWCTLHYWQSLIELCQKNWHRPVFLNSGAVYIHAVAHYRAPYTENISLSCSRSSCFLSSMLFDESALAPCVPVRQWLRVDNAPWMREDKSREHSGRLILLLIYYESECRWVCRVSLFWCQLPILC